MDKSFLTDIEELRRRARSHIEKGAVTEGYRADRATVLRLLNEALATEVVCVLRYKRHYYTASEIHAQAVAEEFLEHAGEEQQHADQIAERINQLGGEPDFNPEGLLGRSHSEYVEGDTGGWLSGRKVLLSTAWLSAVAPRKQALVVNLTKKRIEEAPPYDPDVKIPREYETQLHDHYGYPYTW